MQFINAIKFGFRNYANFKGVIGRSVFWFWTLFIFVCGLVVVAIQRNTGYSLIMYFLAVIALPTIALLVRRLRDAGFHPGWLTIWLLPFLLSTSGINAVRDNPNFAPDPIAEGNAGYIPIHGLATAFIGLLIFSIGNLLTTLVIAVICSQPTRTKAQGNKRISE